MAWHNAQSTPGSHQESAILPSPASPHRPRALALAPLRNRPLQPPQNPAFVEAFVGSSAPFAWSRARLEFVADPEGRRAGQTTAPRASKGRTPRGRSTSSYTVQQWITACGPAPSSSSSGGGGVDNRHGGRRLRRADKELVFTGGGRTFRTDQCYDPLPTLHVDVHTRDPGGTSWRNHCATAPSDPRRATIQSLVTVNGARARSNVRRDRSLRDHPLQEGTCIADIRRSRSFTRVGRTAVDAHSPGTAPAPRVGAGGHLARRDVRAHIRGLPASLEIRPAHHSSARR